MYAFGSRLSLQARRARHLVIQTVQQSELVVQLGVRRKADSLSLGARARALPRGQEAYAPMEYVILRIRYRAHTVTKKPEQGRREGLFAHPS